MLLISVFFWTKDGQTSSGKTHTMLGGGDQRGVLEMAAEDIFNQISESTSRDFLLRVSFVEIYNETIRDLLSDKEDTTVTIREDPKKGVYCDAIEVIITDYESIIKALTKGEGCTHENQLFVSIDTNCNPKRIRFQSKVSRRGQWKLHQ